MTFRSIQGHRRPIGWLQTAVASQHLGHAYLLHGDEAIGKRLVALAFSKFLHCDHPVTDPIPDACGTCRSCHQVEQGSHPDFLYIGPDDDQKQNPKIKIDHIRSLEHFVIYRPLTSSQKVCLIDNADTMTIEAANALLKTLEDPPDHCVFLLVSSRPEHMLSTIRSRCMKVRFSPLSVQETTAYLIREHSMLPADASLLACWSEGRLGQALQLSPADLRVQLRQYWTLLFGQSSSSAATIIDMSEDLVKSGQAMEALHWFTLATRELLCFAIEENPAPKVFHEFAQQLQEMSQGLSPALPLQLLEELERLARGQQRNLNIQIGLEQFFFHLHDQLGKSLPQSV